MDNMNFTIPSQGLEFRHWKFVDIPEVIRINRVCLPENYSRGTFLGLWREFPDLLFLSFDNSAHSAVGYVIEKMDEGTSFFGDKEDVLRGHIFSLAVLPEYRRRGIASTLLALAFKASQERGGKEVFLEVRKSNIPAINLYKKFNMKIIDRVQGYYADGEASTIMAGLIDECEQKVEKIIRRVKKK